MASHLPSTCRRFAVTAAAVLACVAGGANTAGAASWRAVPGTEDAQVDLGSVQVQRTRVVAWLRWAGRGPQATDALAATTPIAAGRARVYRTAQLTEFDCARRTARALATNTYDSGGRVLLMSSLPEPARPVTDGELGWAYDALCEVARAGRE